MMFKWRNVLLAHLDELTELCSKELGKNLDEARGDVLKAIEPTEHACSLPTLMQGDASLQVTTGFDTATYRMPLGVVAGIIPFNFPAMIPWGWVVPLAIATGNTVVLKAASLTPLTSMRILELFYEEGGFPKGVVNLVTCSRNEAELFLTDPRVKAVTFVGTTDVGKHIYSVASANGKRVQAQCEAKNHALVLEDADLESATNAIINSTYGCAGMRCMALPVIVIQESVADQFVALLKKKAMALKVGCAYDPDTKLGPVVSAGHKQKVCNWIQKGVDEGAELVLDGRDERLKFLGLDGILTATCCPNCVGFLKGPAFNRFTLDGGVEVFPSELFDGAGKMDCYVRPEDYRSLTENPFVLGGAPVPLFYGAACDDVNTVGGFANWVQDWEYTVCPHCGKDNAPETETVTPAEEVSEETTVVEETADEKTETEAPIEEETAETTEQPAAEEATEETPAEIPVSYTHLTLPTTSRV